MARVLSSSAPPPTVFKAPARTGRQLERVLLFWNLPLVVFAAWGVAAAQPRPSESFPALLTALGTVWLGCLALHVILTIARFDGDPLILPLLSTLLLTATAFHAGVGGPSSGPDPAGYVKQVFWTLGVIAIVTSGGKLFKRLSVVVEEKIWWRVVGDRPYYPSVPFHLMLVVLMLALGALLLVHHVRTEGGALVQVMLPGGIRFTPSEVIRLAVAFFLADYLGRNSRLMRTMRSPMGRVWPFNRIQVERRTELTVVLITLAIYCFFFYIFHDFGPAAVIIVLTLVALYAATGRALTPAVLGAGLIGLVGFTAWKNLAFRTLHNRLSMWVDPWHTTFRNGDHQARILWSIASGGWFGMGSGTQPLAHHLPLARNDAAFAGIAATMGMWTGLAVLALFGALTWRGMLAARQAPTDRTRLLAFCLTTLLAFQAIWIAGAMVRIFPFTGINLPFVSTGLTSAIASAIALGAIWNVSRPVPPVTDAPAAWADATEATSELLHTITRLAPALTAAFALPAIGLLIYGCPWIQGDRTLVRPARAIGRGGESALFYNPYLEQFKSQFPRGRIFSGDGRLLAVSNPSPEEIQAIRQASPHFAEYVQRREKSGPSGERYYPLGKAAAQLVGWTPQGRFAALPGSVETSWDPVLRGYQPNKLPFYFRNRMNPLVRPPEPQDLQLTISAELQQAAADRLARAVREWGGSGGALVVFDVANGAVLAAATAPSLDPNDLTLPRMQRYVQEDPKDHLLINKALSPEARYFPGSSFKIVTAGAALAEGIRGTVSCRGGHNAAPVSWEWHGKRWRRDPGKISDYAHGGHGTMDLSRDLDRAMAVSCNVFFAQLAAKLGPDRFKRAMVDAEIARVPGVEEIAEHLPYDGFGQIDVKASPLEMAMIAGAAAAARDDAPDTPASRPNWIQAVVTRKSKRVPEGAPGAPNTQAYRPFPSSVAQRLRHLMTGVVDSPSGTAHAAFYRGGQRLLPGITVGGKTGTAEFEKSAGKRERPVIGRHAWFVGFARSDSEPQPRTIAYAVLVEDVRRGATGGQVCAPVARDMIARVLPISGGRTPGVFQGLDQFYRKNLRGRLPILDRIIDGVTDLSNRISGFFNR